MSVKLDGPELWEIVFAVTEGGADDITDDQYTRIAEAINTAFIAAKDAELSLLAAQNEWLKARLAFLQLPPNQHRRREAWLVESGMPSGGGHGRS